MRVLVCIPCLKVGGSEIQTLSLVKALVSLGYDVMTVCYFEYDDNVVSLYKLTGCKVVCIGNKDIRHGLKWQIKCLWKGLKSVINEWKPDVAHTQFLTPGVIPVLILRSLGVKKIITTVHTMADLQSRINPLKLLKRRVLKSVICVSRAAERSFFDNNHELNEFEGEGLPEHITVANCLPYYITVTNKRRDYTYKNPVIGYVGRLERVKGIETLLKAFNNVPEGSSSLIIIGDGSLGDKVRLMIVDMGLASRVRLLGAVPPEDIQKVYDEIDILVIPSQSEGFGLSVVEGMARGCVVVGSNIEAISEIMNDGINGLLFDKGNPSDLAAKITQLLNDKTLMMLLSENARLSCDHYSFERYRKDIETLYSLL